MDEKNQDSTICCLKETHFKYKDTYRIKVKGWRKINQTNTIQKKGEEAILISVKTDFRAQKIIRDKEGHYIMVKESIL